MARKNGRARSIPEVLSLRSKPLSSYAHQHLSSSCCKRLGTQAGFAALVSLETVGEQLSRACIGVHYLPLLFASRLRLCRDRSSLVPQSSRSALHLSVGGSISRIRHRLEFFCFICRGNRRLQCLSIYQVEGTVI